LFEVLHSLRRRKIYRRNFFRRDDFFRRSLSPVRVDDEMTTVAQPEIFPETDSDWINALTDKERRLRDAAVETSGGGRITDGDTEAGTGNSTRHQVLMT
jgi:hypothetical protein